METKTVLYDDFSSFPLGPFPYDSDHSAMGEYHYFPEVGYKGIWYDPITNWDYKGPSWLVTSSLMDGSKLMEQMRLFAYKDKLCVPVLRTGDDSWKDYTVEIDLRVFRRAEFGGLAFRYQTSMMHYGFYLSDYGVEFHKVYKNDRTVLAKSLFDWNTDEFYTLKVVAKGDVYKCYVNDKNVFEVQDSTYKNGCIALSSCVPSQYKEAKVTMDEDDLITLNKTVKKQENNYSSPKLIKTIDLKDFGAGRQIRFGHLTGTKELFFIICQHQRRVYKDRYPFISCMTAVSIETGEILWQIGTPRDDEDVIELTTDLPIQVYDIDNDGIDEVITALDFKLLILDGRNGDVKKEIPTPLNTDRPEDVTALEFGKFAFNRLNVDAIRIVNVSGKERPSDILIKDRYSRIWVFDENLNLLWKFNNGNTGHFPFSYDFDKDGKDEIFSCYNLIDDNGKLMWKLPIDTDHTDEIIVGEFNPDKGEQIAMVSGWEGFMIVNFDGSIQLKDINGHGQRITIGNYLPERKGLEICTTTYWNNNCIIYLHDCEGKEIWHKEVTSNGSVITPVNWDGSGKDLILINAEIGIINGEGDVVLEFPKDGHPTLCAEVLDLDDDYLDEIILWDRKKMYIYTQSEKATRIDGLIYTPIKYPNYNASNYRGEYSFPKWKKLL